MLFRVKSQNGLDYKRTDSSIWAAFTADDTALNNPKKFVHNSYVAVGDNSNMSVLPDIYYIPILSVVLAYSICLHSLFSER